MSFYLIEERLVSMSYPDEIMQHSYDASFSIRGLWSDARYSKLL